MNKCREVEKRIKVLPTGKVKLVSRCISGSFSQTCFEGLSCSGIRPDIGVENYSDCLKCGVLIVGDCVVFFMWIIANKLT